MKIYNIKMIYYSELCAAASLQFGEEIDYYDGKLTLGFDSWEDAVREVYFGNDIDLDDPEWDRDPIGRYLIAYLRDVFPYDEAIYIHFGA